MYYYSGLAGPPEGVLRCRREAIWKPALMFGVKTHSTHWIRRRVKKRQMEGKRREKGTYILNYGSLGAGVCVKELAGLQGGWLAGRDSKARLAAQVGLAGNNRVEFPLFIIYCVRDLRGVDII